MNLSLKNRIVTSFLIANLVVLVLGFTVFFYLDSLNKGIERITEESNRISSNMDEIRISAVSILKYQRKILTKKTKTEDVDNFMNLCVSFEDQLDKLRSHYSDVEIREVISRIISYVDSLKLTLSKISVSGREQVGNSSIGELADKIMDAFSELQDIQYMQNEEKDKRIKKVIGETKRNMLITLIITFLGTILLGLIIPGKIALPFKKINDAIRELQECNFDVSIYYNQEDEIGEIAQEINKMIYNLKKFEELRTDRIAVETRKFDALANMLHKYVLLGNAKGELIYMNSSLYSFLQLQSDDVIGKEVGESLVPTAIKETLNLAIKRRAKLENQEVIIPLQRISGEQVEGEEPKEEEQFVGFANVIPIRGKSSSLDYYLMVISEDVIV